MSRNVLAGLALAAVASTLAAPVSTTTTLHHDDPIVIDNPRISVRRGNGAMPAQEGSDKRWTLHDMDAFHKIVVTTTHGGLRTTLQKPLYGHDRVRFALASDGRKAAASFAISLVPGGQQHDKAIVESSHDDLRFDLADAGHGTKIVDRSAALHIGQIQIGNSYICVADAAKAVSGACSSWHSLPDSVQILICANDGCAVTAHP